MENIENMELTYRQEGDYLVPDLVLSENWKIPIDKWGRMRERYLKEYRSGLWNELILTEKLNPHLHEIDVAARQRLDEMMPKLAAQAGATEELKRTDPLKWVGLMNACQAQVEEIIAAELIYV